MIEIGFHRITFILHAFRKNLHQLRLQLIGGMMPKHAFADLYVMICHTFKIRRIDAIHVYQRIAHFIFSTIDISIDNAIDTFVSHDMYVHGYPLCISLTRDVCQFLFRPVGDTLLTARIERLHKTCAAFHRAVHEELEPVRFDVVGSIFLGVTGLGQCLIHVHPAIQFPCRTQYEVHVTGFVHLVGCLIEIVIKEIGGVAIEVHRVTL